MSTIFILSFRLFLCRHPTVQLLIFVLKHDQNPTRQLSALIFVGLKTSVNAVHQYLLQLLSLFTFVAKMCMIIHERPTLLL